MRTSLHPAKALVGAQADIYAVDADGGGDGLGNTGGGADTVFGASTIPVSPVVSSEF